MNDDIKATASQSQHMCLRVYKLIILALNEEAFQPNDRIEFNIIS